MYPVQTSPNPKASKKIARLAHLTPHSGGRGGAIFSISSALDALDPECHEKMHLDVSSWLTGPVSQSYFYNLEDSQR